MKYLLALCLLIYKPVTFALPLISEYEQPYEIHGSTAEQLRDQMNQVRPLMHGEKFDADTEWNLKWSFDYQPDDNSCVIRDSQVTLDIIYHLPRWEDEERSDPKLQERWAVYMKHLLIHESGHAKNGKKAAMEVEAMLKDLAPMESCSLLEEMANDRARQIIDSHHSWDLQYDKETQHGVTQGAVFP